MQTGDWALTAIRKQLDLLCFNRKLGMSCFAFARSVDLWCFERFLVLSTWQLSTMLPGEKCTFNLANELSASQICDKSVKRMAAAESAKALTGKPNSLPTPKDMLVRCTANIWRATLEQYAPDRPCVYKSYVSWPNSWYNRWVLHLPWDLQRDIWGCCPCSFEHSTPCIAPRSWAHYFPRMRQQL